MKPRGGVKRSKYHEWLHRRWESRAKQAEQRRQTQEVKK